MRMRTFLTLALVALAVAVLAAPASAQDKFQKCKDIQVEVDVKRGNANWNNGAYVLRLQVAGEGWNIYKPDSEKGRNIRVPVGSELRLNFNDSHNHQVNVNGSTGRGRALDVRAGSRPAIVLVKVNSKPQGGTATVKFDITGSPNEGAHINGCTGGSLYFDIE